MPAPNISQQSNAIQQKTFGVTPPKLKVMKELIKEMLQDNIVEPPALYGLHLWS